MSNYVAALLVGKRVVTGSNHGDAFAKLTEEEKNGELISGFLDHRSGRFFSEEYELYTRRVYLIRHGEACGQYRRAKLTQLGLLQAQQAADYLQHLDIGDFEAFTSPFLRCTQTSSIISNAIHLNFTVSDELEKKSDEEDLASFLARIDRFLEHLPAKTILVSHTDYIIHFIQEALGIKVEHAIPNGSITMINAHELVYCGRTVSTLAGQCTHET